jgi:hypothetical protein
MAVNARQMVQLQREIRERTIIAEIGRTVSSTIDWDKFANSVQALLPCDGLVLAILAEGSKSIVDKYVFGVPM